MECTKKAFAKVNLTLEILGTKRNDGYHDIASVMHKVEDLYDEVCVRTSENSDGNCISLFCNPEPCAPESNLAYKAAKAYLEKYTEKTGKKIEAHIRIKKNIPCKAGLAGGSSDAAAVLDALNSLLKGFDDEEIHLIASQLGSDVPFCLEKYTCALCTGRGEKIKPLKPLKNVIFTVKMPDAAFSTSGIYKEYDERYGDDYSKNKSVLMAEAIENEADLKDIALYMCNDFEELCAERCNQISELRKELEKKGFYAQMSGSGSAVFGIKEANGGADK